MCGTCRSVFSILRRVLRVFARKQRNPPLIDWELLRYDFRAKWIESCTDSPIKPKQLNLPFGSKPR
jgi:hypothetical protein